MRSSHSLDRVDAAFDGTQFVADAGLLLPATLAQHLGLRELVERHLDLGRKPGQANRGDKLLTGRPAREGRRKARCRRGAARHGRG